MHWPPGTVNTLAGLAIALIPPVLILFSAFLSSIAHRYASRRWTSQADADRREALQAAISMGELHEHTNRRLTALEARVRALEGGAEGSSSEMTALCERVSKIDKIERAMRRRNLWDSTTPGQITP